MKSINHNLFCSWTKLHQIQMLKLESTLTQIHQLTNRSNHKPDNAIQPQKLIENKIVIEPRISVTLAEFLLLPSLCQ